MRKYFFLFFLVFIIISGCKDNVPPTEASNSRDSLASSKEIWPMAVGNKWTYDIFSYDTSGNVTGTSSGLIYVIRDSIINNCIWYKLSPSYNWYTNSDSGLYRRDGTNTCLYYKYPGMINDSYYAEPYGNTAYIISTDTSITTKAGKYSCYAYSFNRGFVVEYCSVGIGLIKSELYFSTNTGKRYLFMALVLSSVSLE
jgi:hypothetical protein